MAEITQDTEQPAENTGAAMDDVIESTEQPASSEPSNEQLTAEIKVYLGQIGQNIIEVGTRLIIMKGRLQHGEWLLWLKDNFNLSQQTASNFMRCAERFGNYQTSGNLKPSQMVEMLALPADETEQFIEEKAAAGTPVEDMTVKKLREEIQHWKARAEEADKKIADSNAELSETKSELQDARNARDAAISAARDAEEKLQNQQPQVVIQAPEDYDATKQALKDAQTQNQQLQEQLAMRPVEVQVPADYHENKKALAKAQEELASNRKALTDAQGQIAELTAQAYNQNNERFSAEEYAAVAQKLDAISAMITEVTLKKPQGLSGIISDYRKNNPQRLEQIIELFENFVRVYKN